MNPAGGGGGAARHFCTWEEGGGLANADGGGGGRSRGDPDVKARGGSSRLARSAAPLAAKVSRLAWPGAGYRGIFQWFHFTPTLRHLVGSSGAFGRS